MLTYFIFSPMSMSTQTKQCVLSMEVVFVLHLNFVDVGL